MLYTYLSFIDLF